MQSAVPTGTLLQNHYRIVQLLGQGGFGRTYLAEDQGRFNERCAIKEFVPIRGEDKFSDKATQLFQREASVLYQISHPQIPKFRATFEEDERLFLVQDYVAGPTYHDVLNQRRQQGILFSETEVRQFLQQLLPVLAHIHARKIIHRDISPDNIILRQADQQPVLIDFGVVKEVVTRMQLDGVVSHATTVGKAGYAPPEQMQTGRAYPSSDLYSLAVTAVVMLTGQEPQALFDDVNAAWNWQNKAPNNAVSPQLARILNKALSYRPGDRFQSVSEIAQALQSGGTTGSASAGLAPNGPANISPSGSNIGSNSSPNNSDLAGGMTGAIPGGRSAAMPPQRPPVGATPPVSQMKTVAVGRANPDAGSAMGPGNPTVNRPTTARQPDNTRMVMPSERNTKSPSMLENPLAVGGLAVGLAAMAGFGGWAVVQNMDPVGVPEPTITSLPPLGSEPTPTPTPTPTQSSPKPVNYEQPRLELEPGVKRTVEGNMRQGDKVNYPLVAQAGQTLSVEQSVEGVLLSVLGPDGKAVGRRANRVARWEGELKEDGEYKIQLSPVRGVPSSDYRLDILLGALPEPEPVEPEPVEPEPVEPEPVEPEPVEPVDPNDGGIENPDPPQPEEPEVPIQPDIQSQQILFPSGSDGVLVANDVGPGKIRRYVVNAREGQIMKVSITDSQGPVKFDVLMPGGEMMADAGGVVWWESYLPVGGDYAIDVRSDQASEFTLEIRATEPIPQAP
ncbi:MAG: serine/threonine-protein kinase [Cyanobacteria bacterium J06598_3]